MARPDWVPEGVDVNRPSAARVYDALLGGFHNFEVDRQAARHGTSLVPDLPAVAVANRRFLARAVRQLVAAGIDQFVDLGAGIPTVGNTHEVARAADPSCRVAYVDVDPVAVSHATALLAGDDRAVALRGDLRDGPALLDDPRLRSLIDVDRPVGLLMVAVLHLIPDEQQPAEAVAGLRAAVAPGSRLALSHLTSSHRPDDAGRLSAEVSRRDGVSLVFRPQERIAAFFGDFDVEPPGLVQVQQWRPDPAAEPTGSGPLILAGVATKPA